MYIQKVQRQGLESATPYDPWIKTFTGPFADTIVAARTDGGTKAYRGYQRQDWVAIPRRSTSSASGKSSPKFKNS